MILKYEGLFSTYIGIIIIILKIVDFSGEILKTSIFRENIENIDVFISIHRRHRYWPFSMSMFRNIEVLLSMSHHQQVSNQCNIIKLGMPSSVATSKFCFVLPRSVDNVLDWRHCLLDPTFGIDFGFSISTIEVHNRIIPQISRLMTFFKEPLTVNPNSKNDDLFCNTFL